MNFRSATSGTRALTFGLVLINSLISFEALAVATILPGTVREIGGLPYYGWVFTAFMLAQLAGIPLFGGAADRRGPATIFPTGILLFSAGLVVAGCARSIVVLIAGRLLQGAGAAALSTAAYVALALAYAPDRQPRVMALLSSACVVPGILGPAIAAGIAQAVGWRLVFLGMIPATLIAGALTQVGLRGLSPSPPAHGDAYAVRYALLLAAGVGLTLGGARAGTPVIAVVAVLGGAALALRALFRLLPAGTLRARAGLPAALAMLTLTNFAFFAVEAFLPLVLTDVRGAGTGLVAVTLTAGSLAWTCGAWFQARVSAVLGRRFILRFGLCFMLAGICCVAAVLLPTVAASVVVPGWVLASLGISIVYQTATLAIIGAAPVGREGEITARMQIANALAVALGAGLGGDLLARLTHDGRTAELGIALLDAAAVAACVLALATTQRVTEGPGIAGQPPR